jgi:predicted N-acyltransferase
MSDRLNITHSILPSVSQIKVEDWNRLFGDLPESHGFFQTLEASRLEGFNFYYVLVHAGSRLELIAPLFSSDLDLSIGIGRRTQKVLRAVRKILPRLLVVRTLFCGSPFGENGVVAIDPDSPNQAVLIEELVRAMEHVRREQRLEFLVFKDFPESASPTLAPLMRLGFLRGDSFPNVVLALPYRTMDEYLASLSYGTRKDLRRKVRKTLSGGSIQVRVVNDVGPMIEPIYQLYLNTYNASTVRFEKLSREYFLTLSQLSQNEAKFFLFYINGQLVCFNLCLRHGGQLIDKFIGMDYTYSRRLNLYFFSWFHNVEWCIQHGIRSYQVGQTDYQAKLRLGGKLVPLSFYARHHNRFLNFLLRMGARFFRPT